MPDLAAPDRSGRAPSGTPSWTLPVGLCVAAYALTLGVFFPGLMTGDAEFVHGDIARGFRGDWQSPVMTLLWSWIDPIAPGPGSMMLLTVTLYWAAFALVALAVARRSRGLALALPLLALSPPAIIFVGVVWRDILFAACWLSAAALVFAAGRGPGPALGCRAAQAVGLGLVVLGVLLRPNALAAAPVLAAALVWPARFVWWRTALFTLAAGLALFLLVPFVYYDLLDATRQHPLHSILVFDLGGISHFAKRNVFPGHWTAAEDALVVAGCYHPTAWDIYWTLPPCTFVMETLEREALFGSPALAESWLRAVLHHPLAYLRHRAAFMATFLVESDLTIGTTLPPDPGTKSIPLQLRRFILVTLPGALAPTPLSRGGTWVLLDAAACALAWGARGTPAGTFVLGVCGAALVYVASFAGLGVATDFRYCYFAVIAGLAGMVVALSSRPLLP